MEHWKKNNLSLHVGDSSDNPLVVSNDEVGAPPSSEDSYQAPPLADHIGPVSSGQQAVHSPPWEYQKVKEEWRKERSKAKRMEPVKGTRAARKRAAAVFEELPSIKGFYTPQVETDEEGSEKEN